MELSKQITSVPDYACLWIILNTGNKDEHSIPMAKPRQSIMLGGEFLLIMLHHMCMWNINLVFQQWKPSEPSNPMKHYVWTMESVFKIISHTVELPKPIHLRYIFTRLINFSGFVEPMPITKMKWQKEPFKASAIWKWL
jgi:hypothetical protein